MNIELLDSMTDEKLQCTSFLLKLKVSDYLEIALPAVRNQGGIEGQRGPQFTTTANRIRERMRDDISQGAILPPLVLGVSAGEEIVRQSQSWDVSDLCTYICSLDAQQVAIIDGVQRTTALAIGREAVRDRYIRVELWIAPQSSALTYRMLVLNTGQVPWNLRRQIEVLNSVLVSEINRLIVASRTHYSSLPEIEIFAIDDKRRRSKACQYQANEIIEMYLAFGLRKTSVDKESALADQFSRLDMVTAVSNEDFIPEFVKIVLSLASFDYAIERATSDSETGKFKNGRAIFDSQPACIGWVVAAAQLSFGRPGINRTREQSSARIHDISKFIADLSSELLNFDAEDLNNFVDLATLNEVLSQQSAKVGDFERAFFLDAFKVLMEELSVPPSLTASWRAY
jgi:hypothetical protein